MRLLVLSDLHLEHGSFDPPDPSLYDVAILAGDILPGPGAVRWARRDSTFGGKPVIFVPGNHEFYNGERTRTLELLRLQAAGSNVHVLDRDEVILGGVRFLGATLWTDFALDERRGTPVELAMVHVMQGLNDFAGLIRERVLHPPGQRSFTPKDAAREHRLSRAWLQERLDTARDASLPTVVVSHHGPSSGSMHPMFEGSRLNPGFYSELPASFFQTPVLWVHGHSHSSSDYMHHATRVVANPRGYLHRSGAAENAAFTSDFIVEIAWGDGHD